VHAPDPELLFALPAGQLEHAESVVTVHAVCTCLPLEHVLQLAQTVAPEVPTNFPDAQAWQAEAGLESTSARPAAHFVQTVAAAGA
jgi:hypothetical protein